MRRSSKALSLGYKYEIGDTDWTCLSFTELSLAAQRGSTSTPSWHDTQRNLQPTSKKRYVHLSTSSLDSIPGMVTPVLHVR